VYRRLPHKLTPRTSINIMIGTGGSIYRGLVQ
jgi:hypothetical protein